MTTRSKLHPKFQSGIVVISGLWGLGESIRTFAARCHDQTAVPIVRTQGWAVRSSGIYPEQRLPTPRDRWPTHVRLCQATCS
jgi:hypothetical protein